MVKIGQTACWRLKVNYNKGREVLFLNSYTTSADQTNVWILLLTQWVTQKKTFLLLLPIMYACVGVVAVELVNLSQSVTYCSYLWALQWRFSLKRSPAPVNCSLWSGYGQVYACEPARFRAFHSHFPIHLSVVFSNAKHTQRSAVDTVP